VILAVDSSIGTSVALLDEGGSPLAERESLDARGHAEAIGLLIAGALDDANARADRVTAVAVGMGPGPFTGLRVGIAAARAFAFARGVPLLPVLSHDAIAVAHGSAAPFVVVTDARRREHYVTHYAGVVDDVPVRTAGPALALPDAQIAAESLVAADRVRASALGALAVRLRSRGLPTGPDRPQYLREPDVTISAGPKRVTP